jgi:NAD(P)-dependent dehydrogenase (short-subunit alcohol dehydrogenase family)
MADVNTLLSTPTPLTIQTQFIQNAYFTLPFYLTFITVSVLTGAWFGVLIAFPLAFIVSVLYQQYLSTLVPVPPKSAIVLTGASTGFGEHAAIRLASLGFLVFATVRKEADGKRLQQQGGKNIVPVVLDVTNNSQISAAVTIVKQRLDRDGLKLMGLINNAGYAISGPIELATEEDLRKQFDVNVVSVVLITQAFTPLLRQAASQSPQHSARIVLLSSAAAHVTFNGLGAYAASKAAIDAIGASFRYELKRWRIDTVLIEPGQLSSVDIS